MENLLSVFQVENCIFGEVETEASYSSAWTYLQNKLPMKSRMSSDFHN